jgi:hypothetical protein
MNAKHTPAPWRVFTDDNECGLYHVRTPGRAVAEPEDEANARLIAAAPELLAALQLAVKLIPVARRHFPKSVRNGDKFDLENACATITAAIAKAKGEA